MRFFLYTRQLSCGLLVLSYPIFAQGETYIFSANKTNTAASQVGSSVSIFSERAITIAQKDNITELLKNTTGINISESSANSNKGVMIRGASNNHTLVMIDGVVVNDPISSGRGFNFGALNTADIVRIEVLKGPQSVLYGSDAMGGVVQITTRQGLAGQKPSLVLNLEGGSYGFNKQSVNLTGSTDKLNYGLGLSHTQEQGISAAEKKDDNKERDGQSIKTGTLNMTYTPIDWLLFDLNVRHVKGKLDYDSHGGVGGDDPNLWEDSEFSSVRLGMTAFLWDDKLESNLSYGQNITKRYNINEADLNSKNSSKAIFKSRTQNWSQKNTLTLHPDFKTIIGFNQLEETGETAYYSESFSDKSTRSTIYENKLPRQKQQIQSIYLNQHVDVGSRWFNTVGFRYDIIKGHKNSNDLDFKGKNHDEIVSMVKEYYTTLNNQYLNFSESTKVPNKLRQTSFTYRVTSRFNITDIVALKGSFGTGFKSPTLYQRFEPTYGNLNLASEKSRGYDLGLVITHKRHTFDVTYFNNDFSNLIEFDSNDLKYYNVAKARMKGFELSLDSEWNAQFSSRLFYTYLVAKNRETKTALIERPRHSFGLVSDFKINEKNLFYVDAKFESGSDTSSFDSKNSEIPRLKAYWLLNVAYEYKFNDKLSFTAKINNVFDKHYQTSLGYGQKRINGKVGLTWVF